MRRFIPFFLAFLVLVPGGKAPKAAPGLAPGQIWVHGRVVDTLAQAFDIVTHGGIIRMGPGVYPMAGTITRNRVRLEGSGPETILQGRAVGGKAALVVKGNGVTIARLACRGISVPDGNGACVRLEGRDLTLDHVVFADSESGLLTAGNPGHVRVLDSLFIRLGKAGRAHAIYQGGGELTVRGTRVIASRDQGHGIKSRASRTTIENSVIASAGGDDSRLVDLPNGGLVTISGSVLAEGAASVNHQLLSFGVEKGRAGVSALRLDGNLILTDRARGSTLLLSGRDMPSPVVVNNHVVGPVRFNWAADEAGNNRFFPDREAAHLPPAPVVPGLDWLDPDGLGAPDAP